VKIRVGFLGAGFIARFHSKMLKGSGLDLEWSGVYDPEPDRAHAFFRATGAPPRPGPLEVISGCDAVFVCTWTSEHRAAVEAACQMGRAVFCEKPLAPNLEDATAMCRAVESAGVTNQVGLVLRYSPAFCWMSHLVSRSESGRVMGLVFRDDQYLPVQGMYGSRWRADAAKAGSGVLLEHSIHDLDMVEVLTSPVVRLSAMGQAMHGIEGIEDAVSVSFELAAGGVGSLVTVWHDLLERPSLRRVEVICESLWCALEGDDWLGPVAWTAPGQAEQRLGGRELAARVRELGLAPENPDAAFLEAVAQRRPARPDFADALRAHVVVDAAYRSVRLGGQPVEVPEGVPGLGRTGGRP